MSIIKDQNTYSTPTKKLRFRGDLNLQNFDGRIEEIFDDINDRRKLKNGECNTTTGNIDNERKNEESPSFFDFFKVEMTRGYILEHDQERYSARRQKIYSFMKIPREVEKFMYYGVIQCADSFLYIHTFLPIRYILALWGIIFRPIASCLGFRRKTQKLLTPAEICDLLKGSIWIFCSLVIVLYVDTNRIYHVIKSQSIIKLYIFYNMLEVGDRLLSAFGQDTIDSLFWTATEPKNKKREHFGILWHIFFATIYVMLHSCLTMFQATTLNVAINSNNKGLLTIMISNNFVELKGSVFKKFDKNNLFQLTCSDVRERFHLCVLLFVVVIQTMKEFNWSLEQFYILLPDCVFVLLTETLIDWLKHAFITRFNELPVDVYREYTISLAYDMTQTRQKHAYSDHSDLVARRMGFIPFPLSVVLIKALYTCVSFDNLAAFVLALLVYISLMSLRILNTIYALGKACDLMKQHQDEKIGNTPTSSVTGGTPVSSITGINVLPSTPASQKTKLVSNQIQTNDQSTSPVHSFPLQRAHTVDVVTDKKNKTINEKDDNSLKNNTLALGATALFSNSDVDLDDVCLNEKVLNTSVQSDDVFEEDAPLARSVPDLQQEINDNNNTSTDQRPSVVTRTHKRSESEPSIQSILARLKKRWRTLNF
ncbi:protein TAPT1 homolog isoform X2 [Condylostylus longicornis]|uniref:protein TAPT1 homolog isoform X2 n=1 Tax=Condylostylus longicornis TaxID=2530218 RepID=UPI00244DC871|nr:protein TAPT1 homolog isoform X2 [Condylostylus longicornis]